MFDKLAALESRYQDLMASLGTSAVQSDPAEYRKQAKALSDMEPLVEKFREYKPRNWRAAPMPTCAGSPKRNCPASPSAATR